MKIRCDYFGPPKRPVGSVRADLRYFEGLHCSEDAVMFYQDQVDCVCWGWCFAHRPQLSQSSSLRGISKDEFIVFEIQRQ